MSDEDCQSVWAQIGFNTLAAIFEAVGGAPWPISVVQGLEPEGYRYFVTAWKPNKEDIEALLRGEPVYIKTLATGLPPMALYTLDEKGNPNI